MSVEVRLDPDTVNVCASLASARQNENFIFSPLGEIDERFPDPTDAAIEGKADAANDGATVATTPVASAFFIKSRLFICYPVI